jgi:hypothetical protein
MSAFGSKADIWGGGAFLKKRTQAARSASALLKWSKTFGAENLKSKNGGDSRGQKNPLNRGPF